VGFVVEKVVLGRLVSDCSSSPTYVMILSGRSGASRNLKRTCSTARTHTHTQTRAEESPA
jgi:hypothetical protein